MRAAMKKTKVVAALTGVMLVGGIAFAAWTATGTGSGTAKAISAQALSTLDATASTVDTLYPGNNNGDVRVTFSNPNPYPVTITTISDSGAIVTSPTNAACDASTGVTFDDQTSLTLAVPASGSASFTLPGAANMSNASVNDCQGKTFVIPITFSGQSG